jgi:hypothetical protein
MVAMADLRARSLREPVSSNDVRKLAIAIANLRDGKFQGSDAGLEITGLETVGVAVAFGSSLVRGGSDVLFAFE